MVGQESTLFPFLFFNVSQMEPKYKLEKFCEPNEVV